MEAVEKEYKDAKLISYENEKHNKKKQGNNVACSVPE
jgi:hypothetical protein